MTFPSSPSEGAVYTSVNGTVYTFERSAWRPQPDTTTGASDVDLILEYFGQGMSVTPVSLPVFTAGVIYSQTLVASGGNAPYTYALDSSSDALPSGLSLNSSSGVLSGTSTFTGTRNLVFLVTDTYGFTKEFARTLTGVAPTITLAAPTASGTSGTAYSSSAAVSSGGTAPYTYAVTSGALPTGVTLNASTGDLSGTPSAAGSFTATITATDANGFTGSRSVTWTIAAPAILVPAVGFPTFPAIPANFMAGQLAVISFLSGTYYARFTVSGTNIEANMGGYPGLAVGKLVRLVSHPTMDNSIFYNVQVEDA